MVESSQPFFYVAAAAAKNGWVELFMIFFRVPGRHLYRG
jgi:hypothetical protein